MARYPQTEKGLYEYESHAYKGKPKMMENMQTYGGQEKPGYKPAGGSAGSEAFGLYATKHNPRPVPQKGSSIPMNGDYGMTGDKQKAQAAIRAQAMKESQRGQGC